MRVELDVQKLQKPKRIGLMHQFPVHHAVEHIDLVDFLGRHIKQVLLQYDQIRRLDDFEGADLVVHAHHVGDIDGVCANNLLERHFHFSPQADFNRYPLWLSSE